jgi:hypothetical protein
MKKNTNSYNLLIIISIIAIASLFATAQKDISFFVVAVRICSPIALIASAVLLYKEVKQNI